MGFVQTIIIGGPLAWEPKQAVLAAALERWSFVRLPARDLLLPEHAQFAPPELTEYLFDGEEDYRQALRRNWEVEDGLPEWCGRFPEVTFAFVSADCFGGTCLYRGYVARSGEVVARVEPDRAGHTRLLGHVGIPLKARYFAPFRRGYFGRRH